MTLNPAFERTRPASWWRTPGNFGLTYTLTSISRTSASLSRSLTARRYSEIATRTFSSASASVAPCDQQPGRPGTDALSLASMMFCRAVPSSSISPRPTESTLPRPCPSASRLYPFSPIAAHPLDQREERPRVRIENCPVLRDPALDHKEFTLHVATFSSLSAPFRTLMGSTSNFLCSFSL